MDAAFGHHLQPGAPFSHPGSGPGRAFGQVGSAGGGGLQTSALSESHFFHLSGQEEGKAILFKFEFLYNLERLFSIYSCKKTLTTCLAL